jgi:hypothetical protein
MTASKTLPPRPKKGKGFTTRKDSKLRETQYKRRKRKIEFEQSGGLSGEEMRGTTQGEEEQRYRRMPPDETRGKYKKNRREAFSNGRHRSEKLPF